MYPRASPGGVPEAAAWHLPPPSGTVSVGVTGYGRDIGDDVTGQIEISGDIRYPEPHGNRPPPAPHRRGHHPAGPGRPRARARLLVRARSRLRHAPVARTEPVDDRLVAGGARPDRSEHAARRGGS